MAAELSSKYDLHEYRTSPLGAQKTWTKKKETKISGNLHPKVLLMFHSPVPVFKSRNIPLLGWKYKI